MIAPLDLITLLAEGAVVAAVPLLSAWRFGGRNRLRRLAWAAAATAFELVIVGAFTRLTDSGLGCPDWPGCFAKASPLGALDAISAAQRALPSGPVTMTKAWIEMLHRFLAMSLGLLLVVQCVFSWRAARRRDDVSPVLSTALVAMVIGIGAFGALTVTRKLMPVVVTTHLLLAISLLGLLTWHALRFDRQTNRHAPSSVVRGLAIVCLGALAIQVALGGWVSTNYAPLVCGGFPQCLGSWWPDRLDFADGFSLFRPLGRTDSGTLLPIGALTAIHVTHRFGAAIVVALNGLLAAMLWPSRPGLAALLIVGLAIQAASGVVMVTMGWPLLAAILHNAGAAAMTVLLVVVNYRSSPAQHAAASPLKP